MSTSRMFAKRKAVMAVAATAAFGLALAGCSNAEEPSDVKGTNPTVVTGDQGAPGAAEPGHPGDHGGDHATGAHGDKAGQASATLVDAKNQEIGTAVFTKAGDGVKVVVNVTRGLTPGFHGMHLHANGVCNPAGAEPFSSAGGHLQVDGHTGHPSSGDLVSIYVGANGAGSTTTSTEAVTLEQITGKSIVIHAGADNFGNIPERYRAEGRPGPDEKSLSTGDAGGRAACGVIKAA